MPAGKREGARPYRSGKTKPLPGVSAAERKVNKTPSARQYPSRETVRKQDVALDRSLTAASFLPVGGGAVRAARAVSSAAKAAKASKQMVRVAKPRSNVRVVSQKEAFPTRDRLVTSKRIVETDPRTAYRRSRTPQAENRDRYQIEKMMKSPGAKVKVTRTGDVGIKLSKRQTAANLAEREKRTFEKRAAAGITGDRPPRSAEQVLKDRAAVKAVRKKESEKRAKLMKKARKKD